MKFQDLHEAIPYVVGGKEKSLYTHPYPGIRLSMPGRHAKDTTPVGADFVVEVTDDAVGWYNHQFTHTDLFKDVQVKREFSSEHMDFFMRCYLGVVAGGDDPTKFSLGDGVVVAGVRFDIFMPAVQCLAVAEYRRYAKYEGKFGGRFLPFRFAAGIAEGLWDAADAANLQRRGRPGVEILEKTHGTPFLTKELMN